MLQENHRAVYSVDSNFWSDSPQISLLILSEFKPMI